MKLLCAFSTSCTEPAVVITGGHSFCGEHRNQTAAMLFRQLEQVTEADIKEMIGKLQVITEPMLEVIRSMYDPAPYPPVDLPEDFDPNEFLEDTPHDDD